MSLEDTLERIAKAVERIAEAAEAGAGASTSAGKTTAADKDTASKTTGRKPATSRKPAKKDDDAPTVEEVQKVFGEFLGVDDEDVREERKDFVRAMLKKYKAAKATEIPEAKRAEAIAAVKAEMADDDAGEEDGDLV